MSVVIDQVKLVVSWDLQQTFMCMSPRLLGEVNTGDKTW